MNTRQVQKGQVVYYQGELPNTVSVIQSGVVRAYTILSGGNEVNIAVYGEGDFLPIETAYDTSSVTVFYYETLSDCVLQNLQVEEFRAERQNNPDTPFIDNRRYVGALMHVNAIGQATAYEKLGHTLRYLGMRFGIPLANPNLTRINIKLTQQDLANLCTMSRETVNIELNKLKTAGHVMEKNKFYIVKLERLNNLLGEDNITLSI